MKKNIRILHVFGGGVRSGVETYVLSLAKGLAGSGIEITMAPLLNGSFVGEAQNLGFKVFTIGKRFKGDPMTIYRLFKLIRSEGIDIVHTHAENSNLYGRIAAKLAGSVKLVTTVHSFYKDTLRDRYKSSCTRDIIYKQDLWTARFCDKIIAVGEKLKERLIKDGISKEKIKVIHNGININGYGIDKEDLDSIRKGLDIAPGDFVVGTAGRLSPVKNLQMLLHSAGEIKDKGGRIRFLIIGDGPARNYLETMARELGIQKDIIFAGWRMDLSRILSVIDIFVLCSSVEGMSFAILEAMAFEKPVIATDVGCNSEVIKDGVTGFLVPYNDTSSLTDRILRLLNDREMVRSMGLAGRKRVEDYFKAEDMVLKTKDVYMSLFAA